MHFYWESDVIDANLECYWEEGERLLYLIVNYYYYYYYFVLFFCVSVRIILILTKKKNIYCYCTCKTRVIKLVLLIRWFPCFVFNFWIAKYLHINSEISLIFFYKKVKKVKMVILSQVLKEKKKKSLLFSPPICILMSYSYLYFLSIWIKIPQLYL